MSYTYITPQQKIRLSELEAILEKAEWEIADFNNDLLASKLFKDAFTINSWAQIKLVHGTSNWPNKRANTIFKNTFPSYDGNLILLKWAASLCHVPGYNQNTMPAYLEWMHYQNIEPTGSGFPIEYDKANAEAKEKIEIAKNEASQDLSDYRTFLKRQDETKAGLALSQNVTNTVNQFNQAIETAVSDPKKLALYLVVLILIIVSIYFIIKLISK